MNGVSRCSVARAFPVRRRDGATYAGVHGSGADHGGCVADKPMTQTAEQVEMQAAVEEAFVEFVATHTAYHRNSDALPSHAVTLCPQWPKLTQTIRTALALAAAEGAYEGLRSVWQQPDAVTFSTLLGRVIAAQQKAEAEIERRRGELVKCSS